MARPIGTESPTIDTTAVMRQIGALEQQSNTINQNLRELLGTTDAAFSFGSRASRPSSGAAGDRFYASDIGALGGWLYYYTGTVWEILGGLASGTNAVRAAIAVTSVDNGAWFHATDTQKFWEVSGGAWVIREVASTGGAGGLDLASVFLLMGG